MRLDQSNLGKLKLESFRLQGVMQALPLNVIILSSTWKKRVNNSYPHISRK